MKKIKLFFTLCAVSTSALLLATSCSSNKKEDLVASCDSVSVSYNSTVKPIIVANCNSCHSAANASSLGGGTVLDSYTTIMDYVDTTAADGGTLLNDIRHLGNAMPKSASKLSVCDIAKVAHWISEGAKDN